MCSSPKVDNSVQKKQLQEAEEARKREEERAARIKAGTSSINDQFAGFDDNFYGQRTTAYQDYYMPQLEDKFADARKNLTYALARAGILNSTAAGEKQAKLAEAYDNQRAAIQSKALADTDTMRSRVQSEKSALVSQLNATGDADQAALQATAATKMLFNQVPEYSPLGDIFSGFAAGIGNYQQAQTNNAILSAAGLSNARRSPSTYVS